jgi:hypothetical protein
LDKAVFDEKF